MKTKYLLATLIILISFTTISTIEAQESKEKETPTERTIRIVNNFGEKFTTMVDNATFVTSNSNSTCSEKLLLDKINKKDLEIQYEELLVTLARMVEYIFPPAEAYLGGEYDKGLFNNLADRGLYALSNTSNFTDFIKGYTGKTISDIKGKKAPDPHRGRLKETLDIDVLTAYYKKYKEVLKNGIEVPLPEGEYFPHDEYLEKYKKGSCIYSSRSKVKVKKIHFPKITWEINTVVTVNCDCSNSGDITKVKSGVLEYSANITSELPNPSKFTDPINSKVYVKRLNCCPAKEIKEEESKTALNDTKESKGYFQIGIYGGIPLGEEKDFYSLNYGGDVAYLFNVSDNFSAGVGVGYTRFTGIDGIDGAGFAPIFSTAEYDFSDKFVLESNVGYGMSTEKDGEGGLYLGVGIGWRLTSKTSIRPRFSFIKLGESSFKSVGVGITATF